MPLTAQTAPVPVLPETIVRGADGSVTVRAVRLEAPLTLDGTLDEPHYQRVQPASGFIQIEPSPGALAQDQTEFWIMFDDENLYMAARAWDSDMEIVTTEMRRDNLWSGNDIVGFSFDTFRDRRNALVFHSNSLGARHDGQSTNESQWNGSLNPVWAVATGRFDGGWTLEAVIPFKSLRYGPGRQQTWGLQVLRPSRSINEVSFLTELPPARGQSALHQHSLSATLVGIEAPPSSRTVELKPFLTSSATTDVPSDVDDLSADVGLDAKVGITDGLTADFTVNTDFAQVEADEEQVNLTRFSLFFPEKREFFLENAGTFSFGGVPVSGGGAGGGAPILFYSRRIGLEGGLEVPLVAGGRATGRVGPFSLGLINIQTDEVKEADIAATNFSVVRLRRDILRRSTIGMMATARSVDSRGGGANYAYGLDSTLGFSDDVTINTYWARTETEGCRTTTSATARSSSTTRIAMGSSSSISPWAPTSIPRSASPAGVTCGAASGSSASARGRRGSRRSGSSAGSPRSTTSRTAPASSRPGEQVGEFSAEFINDDTATATYTGSYEFLPEPFEIAPGITLPVGGYGFDDVQVSYNMAQQRRDPGQPLGQLRHVLQRSQDDPRRVGGRGTAEQPVLARAQLLAQCGEVGRGGLHHPSAQHAGHLRDDGPIVRERAGAVQLERNAFSTNARLRWEYQPGSELFVVYNEQRDTLGVRYPDLVNRAFIVKVTRLFRFLGPLSPES